jgi:hypothetical protein
VYRQGFCRHGPGCRFKHIKLGAEDCPPEADLTLVQQQGAVSIEQQQQQQPASTAAARAGGVGSSNSATAAAGSSSTSSSSAAKQQQQQQQQHTRGPRGGAKRRGDASPRAPPVIGQVCAASHTLARQLSLKQLSRKASSTLVQQWNTSIAGTVKVRIQHSACLRRLSLVLHVSASSVFASMLTCCQCCVWFVQLSEAEMSSMERSMPFSKDAVARYFLVKSPNYEVSTS